MPMRKVLTVCVLAGLAAAAVGRALADEGLWPLDLLPAEQLAREHAFRPDRQWLVHVQKSCVRFAAGGSGCLVSPNGLVLTNHHIGAAAVRSLSDARHDYVRDGFWAPTVRDELRCPGLRLQVLMEIRDITERIEALVNLEMAPGETAAARRGAISDIQKRAARRTGFYPEIVPLFGAARRHLYLYKQYDDVRLVMAPELGIAVFGGDEANFEYPRYSLDMCFFRVYENGQPARTGHYFKWATSGLRQGHLVLAAGHPARTKRLLTADHLAFLGDAAIPFRLNLYNQREVSLLQVAARGGEHRRIVLGDLFEVQNARKALEAQHAALLDEGLLEGARQEDEAMRCALAEDPELEAWYRSPWKDISQAIRAARTSFAQYYLLEGQGAAFGELFGIARDLVRMDTERNTPDARRLPEHRTAEQAALHARLISPPPIHRELERVRLRDGLSALARNLGSRADLVSSALGGTAPDHRAAEIIAGTRLDQLEVRKRLLTNGARGVADSDDPMIRLAKSLDPFARRARSQYETRVLAVVEDAYSRIARLRWEIYAETVYPEATGTLRLSVGTVAGYEQNGHRVPAATTLAGAYELAARDAERPAYRLPQRWLDRRDGLDLNTPFNFVATLDITGGSSGSPVLDRQARIVGLVFDGNRQALSWDFSFDQRQGRAVALDARAIIETLRKLYDADRLADELLDGCK